MEKIEQYKNEEAKEQEEQMKLQMQNQQFPISPKQGVRQKVKSEEKEE